MKADTKAKAGGEMKAQGATESKEQKAPQRAGDRAKPQTTGQGAQGQMDQRSQPSTRQGTQAPAERSQTPAERSQAPTERSQAPAQRSGQGAQAPAGQPSTAQSQTTTSTSVNLTSEQKTRIRTTVLQSRSAPRVSNVNFSLSVGTVVPRSVKVVAVPSTLVEIHPAWRGYMYFIVGDEIIIVEPRTLRIVAVLDV
jgi:hypothetical protein